MNLGAGSRAVAAITVSVFVAGCVPLSAPATTAPSPTTAAPTAGGSAASPAPSQLASPTVAGWQSAPGDSVVGIDASSGGVIRVVGVGPDPKLAEIAAGHIWTLDLGDGSLSRIGSTSSVAARVEVEGEAVGMAADGDDLWVAHGGRLLSRLDGATGIVQSTMTLAADPIFALRNAGFVAVAGGTAWLTVPVLDQALAPHALWQIELSTGSITHRMQIGRDPLWPVVGEDALWVPVGAGGLVRVDLESRQRVDIDAVQFPVGVAEGEDAIWVAVERSRQVLRLAPLDGAVLAVIQLADRPRGITVGGGSVWATTEAGVVEIDPSTHSVLRSIALVDPVRPQLGPTDPAYLDGMLWVPIE